jgi:hypothetical protein
MDSTSDFQEAFLYFFLGTRSQHPCCDKRSIGLPHCPDPHGPSPFNPYFWSTNRNWQTMCEASHDLFNEQFDAVFSYVKSIDMTWSDLAVDVDYSLVVGGILTTLFLLAFLTYTLSQFIGVLMDFLECWLELFPMMQLRFCRDWLGKWPAQLTRVAQMLTLWCLVSLCLSPTAIAYGIALATKHYPEWTSTIHGGSFFAFVNMAAPFIGWWCNGNMKQVVQRTLNFALDRKNAPA